MTQHHKNTILVVEEEWSLREVLDELLTEAGYRVVQARDGGEALEYLAQADGRPCLILLDLMLPKVTGVEFLIQRRADPRIADIPVILMTGNDRLIRAGEFLGITDSIEKPFDNDALLTLVAQVCS